jgi:hypothetical protein
LNGTPIFGATDSCFEAAADPDADPPLDGQYWVIVTSPCGSVQSQTATLTILNP